MVTHKLDQEHAVVWDQMKSPRIAAQQSRITHPKLAVWLVLFLSVTYVVYALRAIASSRACLDEPLAASRRFISSWSQNATQLPSDASIRDRVAVIAESERKTELGDIVFGIAASAKLWKQRKNYIKIWYKPKQMRGIVWLDSPVEKRPEDADSLPPVKISADTTRFPYKNRQGDRSAVRISRIVSETLRLGLENVRWFVMGDDDTVFITDNLVRVLNKYDHRQYYYIGSLSESHLQNIYFSYGMAYGGGGFAISYPLAKALSEMQDKCIHRYPKLYGSDDRIQACMAELGVPLTKELGFHQYDVYGNLFGLLAAHPVAPLVTMHHLDIVEPIFPNTTRVQALQRLSGPTKLDSAGLMQQSICYDRTRSWTVSVSWGYAVQIFRGIFSPREMEMPARTFLNWYKRADYKAYAFNTRPMSRNPCQKPFVFYLSDASLNNETVTVSNYVRHHDSHPLCKWNMANPEEVESIVVRKRPDPHIWERSPRRNCCRVVESKKQGRMVIDVGVCSEGEFIGM